MYPDSRTVLIVDDTPQDVDRLSDALEKSAGFTCLKYTCPEEGLERAKANAIDLILLDLHMPGLSGVSFARSLRSMGRRTPILFLADAIAPENRTIATQIGFSACLEKGIGPAQLVNAVQDLLNQAWTASKVADLNKAVQDLVSAQTEFTDNTRKTLGRIEGQLAVAVTPEMVDKKIVQVARGIGEPTDASTPPVVLQAREGFSTAIDKQVKKLAFTHLLKMMLTSKVFWIIMSALGTAAWGYTKTSMAMGQKLENIQKDYSDIRLEQATIRKSLDDIKLMLQPRPSPGP